MTFGLEYQKTLIMQQQAEAAQKAAKAAKQQMLYQQQQQYLPKRPTFCNTIGGMTTCY